MEDILYKLKIVFQITNTTPGLVMWLIIFVMLLALQFMEDEKLIWGKICKILVYAYPVTYSVIFIMLASLEDKADGQVLLGIMIATALPVMEIWVKKLLKCIHMYCKKEENKANETEEVNYAKKGDK